MKVRWHGLTGFRVVPTRIRMADYLAGLDLISGTNSGGSMRITGHRPTRVVDYNLVSSAIVGVDARDGTVIARINIGRVAHFSGIINNRVPHFSRSLREVGPFQCSAVVLIHHD